MTGPEEQAVREFVRVWTNTAYFQPHYREHAQWMRESAAAVAAPLLGLTRDELLARMAAPRPPRSLDRRDVWGDIIARGLIERAA